MDTIVKVSKFNMIDKWVHIKTNQIKNKKQYKLFMVVNSAEKFFDLSHSLTIVIAQNELNLLYDTYSFKHYTKAATKTYTMVLTRHAEVGTPFVSLSVLFSLSFKRKNINTRT